MKIKEASVIDYLDSLRTVCSPRSSLKVGGVIARYKITIRITIN
jgi:hypothetical protein